MDFMFHLTLTHSLPTNMTCSLKNLTLYPHPSNQDLCQPILTISMELTLCPPPCQIILTSRMELLTA